MASGYFKSAAKIAASESSAPSEINTVFQPYHIFCCTLISLTPITFAAPIQDVVKVIHNPSLSNKNITGKEAENLLDSIGITVNKNTVPNEKRSPFVTSGIRIGTAAVTTRGFDVEAMKEIANIINEAIENKDKDLSYLNERVKALCAKYPLYI